MSDTKDINVDHGDNEEGGDHVDEVKSYGRPAVKTIIAIVISSCLLILWSYSFVVAAEDVIKLKTFQEFHSCLFYLMHASTAAMFIILRLFVWKDGNTSYLKQYGMLLVFLIAWAIAFGIFALVQRTGVETGGSEEDGNAPQFTNSEEKTLLLFGAILCGASSLYHLLAIKFLI